MAEKPKTELHGDPACSLCNKQAVARGWCQMHYRRWKTHGDPNYQPWPLKRCTVNGCTRKHKARGLCSLHYRRRKTGLPLDYHAPILHAHRYRSVVRRGHPIADVRGRVMVHRLVLFESIGFGRVPCFWCGAGVRFGDNLCVDHLNHDRHDNKITNLVPACNACNAGRTRKNPRVRVPMYTDETVGS